MICFQEIISHFLHQYVDYIIIFDQVKHQSVNQLLYFVPQIILSHLVLMLSTLLAFFFRRWFTARYSCVKLLHFVCLETFHFPEPVGSVTCDRVSPAFNNNDEMKASYVGTSDQCNLSRAHVDSCRGSEVTFGLWLTLPRHCGQYVRAAQNIFDSSNAIFLSIYRIYCTDCACGGTCKVTGMDHLEYFSLFQGYTVLEKRNHSSLIAQFK